jgi:hypothetical protein
MEAPMTVTEPRTEPLPTRVGDGEAPVAKPRRDKSGSILSRFLTRFWLVLVIAVVVAVSGLAVYRLHGIFGVHGNSFGGGSVADNIIPFNPKVLKLEVWGSPGNVATINYLDVDSQPRQALEVPLPWSITLTTTKPAVPANLVAQGSGNSLGCRITVDGVVKTERVVNEVRAFTFCLDKSA